MKPFLKWAGGKRRLAPEIVSHFSLSPEGLYFEPFAGGAAVFFALATCLERPLHGLLADSNRRLMRTYRGIRNDVDGVIDRLQGMRNEADFYYAARAIDPDALDDVGIAAWMIYINKTCFNGLYRVNRSGKFNVPFGKMKNPNICDERNLRACSLALGHMTIVRGDFEDVSAGARSGDCVYFDPPYVPLSTTSSFTSYTKDGFAKADQERLRSCAERLIGRGVQVILSNADCEYVRDLYADGPFSFVEVRGARSINARAEARGKVGELVIVGDKHG